MTRRPLKTVALGAALAFALAACGAAEEPASGEASADVAALADTQGGSKDDAGAGASNAPTTTRKGATDGARVALDAELQDGGTLAVRVLVRDVANLYAIAAHLTWDAKVLELVGHKGHAMMISSGYLSKTLVKPSGASRVLLGAARYANGGSPWSKLQGAKIGNELWATLTFKPLAAGTTTLTFDPDHSLGKSSDYADLDLTWQRLEVQVPGGAK